MKKIILTLSTALLATSLLTGCANRTEGTVGGAVVGGVAGAALTNGSPVGAVVGAVGGGLIGNSLSGH
jgi:osmotically inducible lipoprotein OsmB